MEDQSARRYEAFSDIVIGFSLAQVGFALQIPKRAVDLVPNPSWFFGFLWAFANVCALWWFHHRLFASVWKPKGALIILNFAWLAVMVLCLYFTRLAFYTQMDVWIWRLYFGSFCIAYALLSLQYVICGGDGFDSDIARVRLERHVLMITLWSATFLVELILWAIPIAQATAATVTSVPFTLAIAASVFFGRRSRTRERDMAARTQLRPSRRSISVSATQTRRPRALPRHITGPRDPAARASLPS